MIAYFQVAVADTGVLIAPNTYHASRETAEQNIKDTVLRIPDFEGKLIIVDVKLPEADLSMQGDV